MNVCKNERHEELIFINGKCPCCEILDMVTVEYNTLQARRLSLKRADDKYVDEMCYIAFTLQTLEWVLDPSKPKPSEVRDD